jgi:hypothetical protein
LEHGLRWWIKNAQDQDNATRNLDLENNADLATRLAPIKQLGEQNGCDQSELNSRYYSTTIMKYATTHSSGVDPLLMWKVCSGFAHGRPWASLLMNERQNQPGTEVDGVTQVQMTADLTRVLAVALPAFHLMTDFVRLIQDRSAMAGPPA